MDYKKSTGSVVKWSVQPVIPWSQLGKYAHRSYTSTRVHSANSPLIYSVIFNRAGLTENIEISASTETPTSTTTRGDILNMIFKVYATTKFWSLSNESQYETEWEFIGSIKKSRDISNRKYVTNDVPDGHRFSVDISQMISDELSYSLVPIGKGTFQSIQHGGMNGGLAKNDNVVTQNGVLWNGYPINSFLTEPNGTYRTIRVAVYGEILDNQGFIHETTNKLLNSEVIQVINSVPTAGRESGYYSTSSIDEWIRLGTYADNIGTPKRMLTNCPNFRFYGGGSAGDANSNRNSWWKKPVRIDSRAEWLYWYLADVNYYDGGWLAYKKLKLKIITFDYSGAAQNTVYLDDFEDNLSTLRDASGTYIHRHSACVTAQNISVYYINANGKNDAGASLTNQIDSNTDYYTVNLEGTKDSDGSKMDISQKYYYQIDRVGFKYEDYYSNVVNTTENYVTFFWLNRLGGIDSYTAKRDMVQGLTISKNVIERKTANRSYRQDYKFHTSGTTINTNDYISDTMRGGDNYKGGREVMSVNAERIHSVYTEPLNQGVAKWLEELITSPNVWIEEQNSEQRMNFLQNSHLRPQNKGYVPVIITNNEIETFNTEKGLVTFNIEYYYAHKLNTQRN